MKLLVLGGTIFLGRHIVEEALRQGHEVTIFSRGQHNPDIFPEAEKLRGDRGSDISALEGRSWDAVIDTSGHFPRDVRATARLLANVVDHYTFISSINVYPDYSIIGINEDTPTCEPADDDVEEMTFDNYGPLKVACEISLFEEMPERSCTIRPGLIVGAYDFSDRFTYWPGRVARGGTVLAPGRPERRVQLIDVRDLAAWTLKAASMRLAGTFNATGTAHSMTMGEMLETCREVSGSDAEFCWVDDATLIANEVGAWVEMPMWLPEDDGSDGLFQIDCRRAIADGLTFRGLDDTVRYTLDWNATRSQDREWRAGMTGEREVVILREFRGS